MFPDVAYAYGAIVVAWRRLDGPIVVQWLGGARYTIDPAMDDSSYCRLRRWGGRCFLMYRAHRGRVDAACLRPIMPEALGDERVLGRASGNSPVCLGDGWAAWQNDLDGAVHGLNLLDGFQASLRLETRPTGLARLVNAWPIFIDEDRFLMPGMLNPVFAEDENDEDVVGEGFEAGLAATIRGRHGFIMPGECNVPRVASNGQGWYVACTWGSAGVRVLEFSAADIGPLLVPEPEPEPIPIPIPVPIPTPNPTEPPMFTGPSLHVWTLDEFPQLVHARRDFLGDPEWQPDPAWVILQMARRYGFGLSPGESPWSLQKMIDHEHNPEGH
jgi:hypothetical protein